MKNSIIILLLGCTSLTATAQHVLTIDECRRMAQEHNKQIQSRQSQTEQARYTMRSVRGNFLPDIKLTGNGLWSSKKGDLLNIPSANLPVLDLTSGTPVPSATSTTYFPGVSVGYEVGTIWHGGISITQPIYMGGKITSGYRMSQIGVQAAETQVALSRQQVEVEVSEAYAMLVKAQEMQQVASQYNALLLELMQNVEAAVRHGMKMRNDEMKVQVKLNESELQMCRAANARRLAAMNLCQVIGSPPNSTLQVSSQFPYVSENATRIADITGRPEHQLLDHQVELARQQVRQSRSELLPQVGVQGSYNYLHGLKVADETRLNDGSFSVLLNVSIPLFHFGERINKVRAAKARVEQAEIDRQHLNEKMQLELSQAVNNLDEALLEVQLADRSLTQAAVNRDLSRRQYEAGMEPLSDYLEAQTLWQQAYETQVEAHYQHYLAYVKYLKAAGRL